MFKQLAYVANPVNIFSELKGMSTWGRYFAPLACVLMIYLSNLWGSTWWATLSAVSGVLCVVLVADRKLTNFFWGLINCSLYGLVSYQSGFYGDMSLNWLLYVPFQFIGLWMWTREGSNDGSELLSNRLDKKELLLLVLVVTFGSIALGALLSLVGGKHPLADGTNVFLSITATLLMAYRYREQWLCWIAVNISGIIMWSMNLYYGEGEGIAALLMWVAFLVNSTYGFWAWSRTKENKLQPE